MHKNFFAPFAISATAAFAQDAVVETIDDDAEIVAAPVLAAPAAGITFKPYGWVKFDAVCDSSRTSFGDIGFWVMPGSAPGGGKNELNFAARDFRFGTWIYAPEFDGVKVTGRFEGDWCNDLAPNAYNPRMRLAYIDIALANGWLVTAGQAWDTYNSNGIFPETLDPGNLGQTGNPYGRHPLARVSKEIKLGGGASLTPKIAVQAGRNSADYDRDGQPDEFASGVPGLHATIALSAPVFKDAPNATFAVSGFYGQEKTSAVAGDPETGAGALPANTYDSSMIHFAAKVPFSQMFTLQGVFFCGENLDNHLAGVGQGVNPATQKEIRTVGGYVNGICKYKDWMFSAGYGIDNPNSDDLPAGARTKNERAFLTTKYNITKDFSVWGEYSFMRTTYDAKTADANRVHMAVRFDF